MSEKISPESDDETEGFGAAIDEATVGAMEASATSKDRGIDRRVMLMTLARDSEALGKMSVDSPDAFGEMREAVDRFKEHAKGLLEVAEAASIRMYVTDCREGAPSYAGAP
jgi:hypothetical protein